MSFLNPVNEPVLRFSSTDANAPQINYNSRVAGDVKTVMKACLVTGYGAKASAGWSIVNEVNHVAEFVSPSGDIGDTRLGIDDTSAIKTTWYYYDGSTRINPTFNVPTKTFGNVSLGDARNGWTMLVTDRGIMLIEHLYRPLADGMCSRMTYWGQIKLAINSHKNVAFLCEGQDGADFVYRSAFFTVNQHYNCSVPISSYMAIAMQMNDGINPPYITNSNVEMLSTAHLLDANKNFIGTHPAFLIKTANNLNVFKVEELVIDDRPYLDICLGYQGSLSIDQVGRSRLVTIPLDYWEY